MKRENISTGGKWEPIIGYSRAVRVGPFVFVSGCTSATAEGVQGKGDAYAQAVQTLKTVVHALEKAGARPEHVVRTRIYLTRKIQRQLRLEGEFLVDVQQFVAHRCEHDAAYKSAGQRGVENVRVFGNADAQMRQGLCERGAGP